MWGDFLLTRKMYPNKRLSTFHYFKQACFILRQILTYLVISLDYYIISIKGGTCPKKESVTQNMYYLCK